MRTNYFTGEFKITIGVPSAEMVRATRGALANTFERAVFYEISPVIDVLFNSGYICADLEEAMDTWTKVGLVCEADLLSTRATVGSRQERIAGLEAISNEMLVDYALNEAKRVRDELKARFESVSDLGSYMYSQAEAWESEGIGVGET